jgi:hypothetical protein
MAYKAILRGFVEENLETKKSIILFEIKTPDSPALVNRYTDYTFPAP